jgi:flagellar basal body-associated protein FliL
LDLAVNSSNMLWLMIFFLVSLKFCAWLKMFYLALKTVRFLTSKATGLPFSSMGAVLISDMPILMDSFSSPNDSFRYPSITLTSAVLL